jgi:CRP-like cAMP-binding protein
MEKRGRAKTMLEGVIKPTAILVSGIITLLLFPSPENLMLLVLGVSGILVLIALRVRTTYIKNLIPDFDSGIAPSKIIADIGSHHDQKILSLIQEFSRFSDPDLRVLAVKILAQIGSHESFKIVTEIFYKESDSKVREMIARSLANFYRYEVKNLIDILLVDPNARIRSNAIYSLHTMNCHWKWRYKSLIKPMLFENNIRIQLEAAQFLWKSNTEQPTIQAFLRSLIRSKNANQRSAGLYLVGILKPPQWESALVNHLNSTSVQIYTKTVEIIFRSASIETQIKTLQIIELMTRDHIATAGNILQKIGSAAIPTIFNFLKIAGTRRMIFEMVHALRIINEVDPQKIVIHSIDRETGKILLSWIAGELNNVFRDCFIWYHVRPKILNEESSIAVELMDDALRERLFRSCEWGLDFLVLFDKKGIVSRGRKEFDLREQSRRLDMIEVVESFGHSRISRLIVSILEFDSWGKISRTGKHFFRFGEDDEKQNITHFLRSDNKWIVLCALFMVARNPEKNDIADGLNLAHLMNDSYEYIVRAAVDLQARIDGEGKMVLNTYDLLETVLFLKKMQMFHSVPAEKLMGLAEIAKLVVYPMGTIISAEGEIPDHLYIVRKGSLRIERSKSESVDCVATVMAGETYGEIGLFGQAPRYATAVTGEESELFMIQRSMLKKLLMDIPELAYNFLEIFSEKLRLYSEELSVLRYTSAGQKGVNAISVSQ